MRLHQQEEYIIIFGRRKCVFWKEVKSEKAKVKREKLERSDSADPSGGKGSR